MSDKADWKLDDLTKLKRGEITRHAFFKHQEILGNTFKRVSGSHDLYFRRACDGVILGITYSKKSGDKWFFNLQADLFQEAVLLCQIGPRSVRALHLPRKLLERYWTHLSRREDQVLFHISKEGQRWLFSIPEPVGKQDVTEFADIVELSCDALIIHDFD